MNSTVKIQNPVITFILALLLFCLATAGLVVWVYGVGLDHTPFNGQQIKAFGLRLEILILIHVGLLLVFLTQRMLLAWLLTALLYAGFFFINLEKIKYFNSPLLPLDVKYLDQLLLVWSIFKPQLITLLIFLVLVSVISVWLFKKEPRLSFFSQSNGWIKAVVLVVLMVSGIKFSGLYGAMKYDLAMNERGRAHLVITAQRDGLLTTFVRNFLHAAADDKPAGYSADRIKEIHQKISTNGDAVVDQQGEPINLVIYLVESFTDPQALGIQTTHDPIPFFRQLQQQHESGYVYAPVVGGRSANSEFEILTGFSKHFFKPSSIPFIDLPYRYIPSVANELGIRGYQSKVIQAASLGFFNYQHMYAMLGFSEIISLADDSSVPTDPSGRSPSDFAVVDEVIRSSQQATPFFIYAFPNSTHGSWNYRAYDDSALDLVLARPLSSPKGAHELRTYLNALHTADQAIQKLIQYFEQQDAKTVVLILGDHQPGMPEMMEQHLMSAYPERFKSTANRRTLKNQFLEYFEDHPLESYQVMHKVPYLIWTNFETRPSGQGEIGMNELATRLFELLDHQPRHVFYHFLTQFLKQTDYQDILKFVYLGGEDMAAVQKKWVADYQQLQYDVLLGASYLNKVVKQHD